MYPPEDHRSPGQLGRRPGFWSIGSVAIGHVVHMPIIGTVTRVACWVTRT